MRILKLFHPCFISHVTTVGRTSCKN